VATLVTGETFMGETLSDVARAIIDGAPEFEARRDLIKRHRKVLDRCARKRDPAKSWNAWRQKHPNIAPMLAEENLAARDFTGFDLGSGETGSNIALISVCVDAPGHQDLRHR